MHCLERNEDKLLAPYSKYFSMHFQIDQLTADLASERSSVQRIEGERLALERLTKELKMKLEEVESQQKAKVKTATQSIESKVSNLEEQLETESRFVSFYRSIPLTMVFIYGIELKQNESAIIADRFRLSIAVSKTERVAWTKWPYEHF